MFSRRTQILLLAPGALMFISLFAAPLLKYFFDILVVGQPISATAREMLEALTSRATLNALGLTNLVALAVTVICLVIGYPIAFFLTIASRVSFAIICLCIIVPYFVSVIVRTYSWMVILGTNGIINTVLRELGFISAPIAMMYNRYSIILGMSYVMLPYMVLTLFATLRTIDDGYVRAGLSLGGSPAYVFRRVYLPLSSHAIYSGSVLVFMLCLGFYVTPALMGASSDVMIAMLIVKRVDVELDFRGAAILSVILCMTTSILYFVYMKVSRIDKLLEKA